jgi:hypothetical protein
MPGEPGVPGRGASRGGFTLLELIVSLFLFLIVGQALYSMLVRTQRISRAQSEQTGLQANVRAGTMIVPNELREIGYDSAVTPTNPPGGGAALPAGAVTSDIEAITANSITFRAMRGTGFTCNITNSHIYVRKPFYGFREPREIDGFLLFVDNTKGFAADDEWKPFAVQAGGVDLSATCPDGAPAIALQTTQPVFGTIVSNVTLLHLSGTPVRVYERMRFGQYTDGAGKTWLGAQSLTSGEAAYQPVVGPLQATNGFQLRYLDKSGVAVAPPSNAAGIATIRTIEVTLRGLTEQAIERRVPSGGVGTLVGQGEMTLRTLVAVRNTLRP